jgi:uncharacterized protein YqeY
MKEKQAEEFGWSQSMPMSLHDKLRLDLKTAVLQKKNEIRDTIRVVMGEYPKLTVPMTLESGKPMTLESGKKTFRVKKPEEITNDDLLGIIRGLVKSEKSVLDLQKNKTSPFLETLQSYLPQMVSREEVRDWIETHVDFSQYKSPMQAMAPVMKHFGKPVMKHFGKRADGSMVKELLQKLSGG